MVADSGWQRSSPPKGVVILVPGGNSLGSMDDLG